MIAETASFKETIGTHDQYTFLDSLALSRMTSSISDRARGAILFWLVSLALNLMHPIGAQAQFAKLPSAGNARIIVAKGKSPFEPERVWLLGFKNRRVSYERLLVTFPKPCGLYMSPSTRYLLRESSAAPDGRFAIYSRDLWGDGEEKSVWSREILAGLVSWSRKGDTAMFFNSIDEKNDKRPTITLVDAHTGTFCELRSNKTQTFLAAFWARDGKHLVYETNDSTWPSPVQKLPGVNLLAARAFYSVDLQYTNRIALGSPRRLSDKQVDAMLGIAFLPVIRAWEKENGSWLPYTFLVGDQVEVAPDGRKAFLFGREVHKESPEWAPPDKVITYEAVGRHVTRRLATDFERTNVPIWSSDERWITFFTGTGWFWLNPSNSEATVIQWPDNEAPLQLLPDDGTRQ